MAYPFNMEVEVALPCFSIRGVPPQANPQCVINEGPETGLPDRIIRTNQPWNVHFHWCVEVPESEPGGVWCDWRCDVYLLKLSAPGGAQLVGSKKVPYNTGVPGPQYYDVVVPIAPNQVQAGMYELHTSVDILGPVIIPVALFGNGPMMKFYQL